MTSRSLEKQQDYVLKNSRVFVFHGIKSPGKKKKDDKKMRMTFVLSILCLQPFSWFSVLHAHFEETLPKNIKSLSSLLLRTQRLLNIKAGTEDTLFLILQQLCLLLLSPVSPIVVVSRNHLVMNEDTLTFSTRIKKRNLREFLIHLIPRILQTTLTTLSY